MKKMFNTILIVTLVAFSFTVLGMSYELFLSTVDLIMLIQIKYL